MLNNERKNKILELLQKNKSISNKELLDAFVLMKNMNIVGADIVEYNPARDFQDMTAYLAAKMTKELLGKMLEQ